MSADAAGARAAARAMERLLAASPPPAVTVAQVEGGVMLSGPGLRLRLVGEAAVRDWARTEARP